MGVLAAIVVFPLETRHLVHAVPPPLPPTLELLVLQTALLPYIYIFINVASPRFRFFSSSSPSLSLFLRSREFEGARTTTRRGKGFEGKQGKDRKTTSVKDSQRDRMTGERGRKAMKSAQPSSSTAHRVSWQCRHARRTVPRVYKYDLACNVVHYADCLRQIALVHVFQTRVDTTNPMV